MTACTNCFSGCTETTSDKCVKYTGTPIEFLHINTGDSLESVEEHITDYLLTVLNGTGIIPVIDSDVICSTVSQYITCEECGPLTLNLILTAIIKAICDLEEQITTEIGRIDTIEANYTPDCISVAANAGTHAILQATINRLCVAINDIDTLNNLYATCITTSNISSYIQNYLNTNSTSDNMYTKMVPYAIYPFYPTDAIMSTAFGPTGAGLGTWQKIYLCNGNNNTPDLRGRSLIGTTTGMGGGSLDWDIDPAHSNPAYSLGTKGGQNYVTLAPNQIASHTHPTTVTINDPGHKTTIEFQRTNSTVPRTGGGSDPSPVIDICYAAGASAIINSLETTAITRVFDKTGLDNTNVIVTTSNNVDGGHSHYNVHPVCGVHYIIYLP